MLSSPLPWVCVEVKFEGLFMGFSSEERGEEEEKERKERERERESSVQKRERKCVLT